MKDDMKSGDIKNTKQVIMQNELLEGCKHSSSMLLNLINDLLDLAKQEKFTFSFNKSYFSLIDTVNYTFKTLEYLSAKSNIVL